MSKFWAAKSFGLSKTDTVSLAICSSTHCFWTPAVIFGHVFSFWCFNISFGCNILLFYFCHWLKNTFTIKWKARWNWLHPVTLPAALLLKAPQCHCPAHKGNKKEKKKNGILLEQDWSSMFFGCVCLKTCCKFVGFFLCSCCHDLSVHTQSSQIGAKIKESKETSLVCVI